MSPPKVVFFRCNAIHELSLRVTAIKVTPFDPENSGALIAIFGSHVAYTTSNDVNNFSAFNGSISEGVTVLPDELRVFKDEKIIWLTVKGGYGVIADRILTTLQSHTQPEMQVKILHRMTIQAMW
ncbi:hypothetical protein RO3G_07874 [Rhizopus delemar RA 99-880]|uniref:Uncharacterized protein n=1 Tax=Rhizopus delemar (strain RA 99-880 / ATCC MYA-4621 / FGSC 9543 / NRRL 43880) TaxID=246409 RepID=I1C3Y9_RHIO9|nr:hypothetical protein RO3G_07874 [Rhizopus delemar RA 99-880]|eukprot:EIE83169.1 hypothetical protein RO3G_07874 [Rhizopus delemar RA 99-880]